MVVTQGVQRAWLPRRGMSVYSPATGIWLLHRSQIHRLLSAGTLEMMTTPRRSISWRSPASAATLRR
jgi:hypothetical protein